MAVAVALDCRDAAVPGLLLGEVLGPGAEDGGDVLGRADPGGDDALVFGVPVAGSDLRFDGPEVADLLAVVLDPGKRVVLAADLLYRVQRLGVVPLGPPVARV